MAQSLLDSGRAFSAHEVLEAVWKAAPCRRTGPLAGSRTDLCRITHAQRGNATGAARLLDRGIDRLRHYAANPPHRVDVSGSLDWHAQHATNPTATDPPRLLAVRPDQSSS
jgi:hypothetical protein